MLQYRENVKRFLRSAYMGMTAGFLVVMLLTQWLWLEMRVNISLALPLSTLAGLLFPVFFKKAPGAGEALIAQLLCILIFFYFFNCDIQALWVVPATWFREGFCLHSVSIHVINLAAAGIFIVGNGSFLFPLKKGVMRRGLTIDA
jgi:hypothetical protein